MWLLRQVVVSPARSSGSSWTDPHNGHSHSCQGPLYCVPYMLERLPIMTKMSMTNFTANQLALGSVVVGEDCEQLRQNLQKPENTSKNFLQFLAGIRGLTLEIWRHDTGGKTLPFRKPRDRQALPNQQKPVQPLQFPPSQSILRQPQCQS